MSTLKILTNNLITNSTNITGLTNTSNLSSFTRATFSEANQVIDRSLESFELEGIPVAYNLLIDSNAKVYKISIEGPFNELDTLFIGPNSLPKMIGGTVAIRLNSLSTGYASTISGVPIYYNQIAVIPTVGTNLGAEPSQEDWVKFGTTYLEDTVGFRAISLEHPGIPLPFEQPVGGAVTSIDLYIAQADSYSSNLIYSYTEKVYACIVGGSELGDSSNIDIFGNNTVSVGAPSTGDEPQYLYTIGLTEFGVLASMFRVSKSISISVNSINSGLAIAYLGLYGRSSELSNTEALYYGELYDVATSAGVGLSINSENSSSLINTGSYLTLKAPSRSRLNVKLPLKLVSRKVLTRLQVLADRGAKVYVQLLSGGDYQLVEERSSRVRDFSRVYTVKSPIEYNSPAYGYYNVEVSLEEV